MKQTPQQVIATEWHRQNAWREVGGRPAEWQADLGRTAAALLESVLGDRPSASWRRAQAVVSVALALRDGEPLGRIIDAVSSATGLVPVVILGSAIALQPDLEEARRRDYRSE